MDVRANIQAEDFAAVEDFLLERLEASGSAALPICHATRADQIEIVGWEEMCATLEANVQIEVAAIGFDVSSYIDPPEDAPKDPAVEIALYTAREDGLFTNAGLETLLELSTSYAAPWTGRGADYLNSLSILGLDKLCAYLMDEGQGDVWAGYFLQMRFQQKMRQMVREVGLPGTMRVLLGNHGFDPWLVTIVMEPKVLALSAAQKRAYERPFRHKMMGTFIAQLEGVALLDSVPPQARTRDSKATRKQLTKNIQRMCFAGVLDETPYKKTKPWMLEGKDMENYRGVLEAYFAPGRHIDDPAPQFRMEPSKWSPLRWLR